jgi:3-oxoacyl-[acyl-carrier-protein] synthase-3
MSELFLDGLPQSAAIGVRAIGTCVRGSRVGVETLEGFSALHSDLRRGLMGATIHDAGTLDGYDLCLGAAEQAIQEAGITASELDFIVHVASRVPTTFITSEIGRLQHDLGAKHATGISVSGLGCADTSMALKVAWDYLKGNANARNVLVAYGHVRYAKSRFRLPVTVNGDGAAAIVLGKDVRNSSELLRIEQMLNGDYWNLFSIDHNDASRDEYVETCLDDRRYGFELAIESKRCFEMLNRRLEEATGFGWSNADHVLLQNISPQAYGFYELAFGISFSPICRENLTKYGHLGGADVFFNLKAGLEAGVFQSGQTVLLMNNSPAAAWSLILLRV